MQTISYQKLLNEYKQGKLRLTGKSLQQLADLFIKLSLEKKTTPDLYLIDLLCSAATSTEKTQAKEATTILFKSIIESLCDDFSPAGAEAGAQVLVRIVTYLSQQPQGSELRRRLNEHGYAEPQKLIERHTRIRQTTVISKSRLSQVKKILILSRVTAGADIVTTNIIAHRLKQSLPNAELVIIGPAVHLNNMFSLLHGTRIVPFSYNNSGSLVDKMSSWPQLLDTVNKERQNYKEGEVLLFDPDTRLSQLGIIPLLPENDSFYFPSRTIGYEDSQQQHLSDLTNRWLNALLNENQWTRPKVAFPSANTMQNNFIAKLRDNRCKFLITVNLGVGLDSRKKLPSSFESLLLSLLLSFKNTVIILDSGKGIAEEKDTQRHLEHFKHDGFNTLVIDDRFQTIPKNNFQQGIIAYKGPLCGLGRLIEASDCYIGYDSCGQHIANAADTPAVILFAGAPSQRFISRWASPSPINHIFPILRESTPTKRELDILAKNVLVAVSEIKSQVAS